ncbi:MAG: hypothetical protein RIF41_16385 [Polyangiaceae bacterium]
MLAPSIQAKIAAATLAVLAGAAPARSTDDAQETTRRSNRCKRIHDVACPDDTRFSHDVPFELGRTDLGHGDHITIEQVRGTSSDLEIGGIYLVKGTYTLASRAEARLSFTVTASEPGEGCTKGNRRGRQTVRRGTGTFELATRMAYRGYPHVWFRVGDDSAGGVYFGKGDTLLE